MKYYAGLDVSQAETYVSIIDESGKIIRERSVCSESEALARFLQLGEEVYERIGLESGQLSIMLSKGLRKAGLPIICVDARHMAKALSARVNKNDQNDARGIAQMMRANLYREVAIKSEESCRMKMVLGSRRQLVKLQGQTYGSLRGLLKIYGIKLGARHSSTVFGSKVRDRMKELDEEIKASIEALLSVGETTAQGIKKLDKQLMQEARKCEDCKRLMTIPGVGVITAMTFKTTVDGKVRFKESRSVGAYLGLTPKQYASGEINRQGRISKMGSKECRTMLYQAALSLLYHSKKPSCIQRFGLKLVKKKGAKKALVAVSRKLAVMMHAMLLKKTDFSYEGIAFT